jgi:hypothetical protein
MLVAIDMFYLQQSNATTDKFMPGIAIMACLVSQR